MTKSFLTKNIFPTFFFFFFQTGSKLGLELDYEKVGAMLEYLTENRVGTDVLRTGGISLQDFREISRHFRVE